MNKSKIFLGIDPGFGRTGFGVIKLEKGQLCILDYGCITTKSKTDLSKRLVEIYSDLVSIIKKHKPDAVCIEKLFFSKNVKTAIDVGHARGVVLLVSEMNHVPIIEITPTALKTAIVGYGRADKKQMQEMIKRMFKLKKIPKPDDAADALALATYAALVKTGR
ncbi:TPA: crossover junction endodeoxyribonuclease RuvC [Candidatus Uhrbacteria bacterium]|nr:crossover junction endodeoxyribonuclease RuvC [Candidatus Uhrbacteria bacterium]